MRLVGASVLSAAVGDNADGTYEVEIARLPAVRRPILTILSLQVTYLATKAGRYSMAVLVDGEAIGNSPFAVNVSAGTPSDFPRR